MKIDDLQKVAVPKLRSIGIKKAGVFGSFARGDAQEDSDIDLLITLQEPTSLLTLVRLERELSEALGRPVDLVTEDALSPYFKDDVLEETRIFYEE